MLFSPVAVLQRRNPLLGFKASDKVGGIAETNGIADFLYLVGGAQKHILGL